MNILKNQCMILNYRISEITLMQGVEVLVVTVCNEKNCSFQYKKIKK